MQAVCRIWSLLAMGKRVLRADLNCSERGSRFGGAARRYAEIASAAPHARHMPSHISRASVIGKTRSAPTWPLWAQRSLDHVSASALRCTYEPVHFCF